MLALQNQADFCVNEGLDDLNLFSGVAYHLGGGVLSYKRLNGDVPLDGVTFSVELLEWGRTFSDFGVKKSSSYLRLANVSECLY